MASKAKADLVVIFYDDSDPRNRGWAYNVIVDGEHTSGPLESKRQDAGLRTLHAQLRREFGAGTVAIPAVSAFRPTAGLGWEAR